MAGLEAGVLVPRVRSLARVGRFRQAAQFDEAHAAFHQPPGQQALTAVIRSCLVRVVQCVELAGRLGLASDVAEFGNLGLHPERRFVVPYRCLDVGVTAELLEEGPVHFVHEIEPVPLRGPGLQGLDVLDGVRFVAAQDGTLNVGRQVAVAVETDAAMRDAGLSALQDDESGEVLVLRAEAVVHPGAGRRMPDQRKPGVKEVVALGMLVHLARHRPDDGEVVDAFADVGEHAADRDAALAVLLEGERRGEDVAVVVELGALDPGRHRLAVIAVEQRLGVERVDLGYASGHVQEDDVFGPCSRRAVSSPGKERRAKHAVQGDRTEAGRDLGQHSPAAHQGAVVSDHRR